MKRETYLTQIEIQLAGFMSMVALRNSAGRFDLNILAEDFFKGLLNLAYGYHLENVNKENKNTPAIDLADKEKRLAFQVTSSDSARKIEKTIQSFVRLRMYEQYDRLCFLIITDKKKRYRVPFQTGGQLVFDVRKDILTVYDLFRHISGLEIESLSQLSKYLQNELPDLIERIAALISSDIRPISHSASNQITNNLKLFLFNVDVGYNILMHLTNGEYGLIGLSYSAQLAQYEPPSLTYLKDLERQV